MITNRNYKATKPGNTPELAPTAGNSGKKAAAKQVPVANSGNRKYK